MLCVAECIKTSVNDAIVFCFQMSGEVFSEVCGSSLGRLGGFLVIHHLSHLLYA